MRKKITSRMVSGYGVCWHRALHVLVLPSDQSSVGDNASDGRATPGLDSQ